MLIYTYLIKRNPLCQIKDILTTGLHNIKCIYRFYLLKVSSDQILSRLLRFRITFLMFCCGED